MNQIKVEYRQIAKMLCKAIPDTGENYTSRIESATDMVRSLPAEAKVALKSAYIFSHKVPIEEREDLFQDLALAVLKAGTNDERLGYTIARCDWQDWWGKYKIRQHYSLDSVVDDEESKQVPLGELLVGEVDYEAKLNGDLDGERLYEQLPAWVQDLVNKRLSGKGIRGGGS